MKVVLSVSVVVLGLTGCTRNATESVAQAAHPVATSNPNVLSMTAEVQRESGVATAILVQRHVPETVRSTARLTNDENRTWRVGSVAEGRIVTVLANVGDFVKEDQILARMHSHQIHEARADYQKANAEVARRKGLIDFSVRVRDRARRLFDLKAGSLEQVERAETDLRNAQTDAANAETDVERARSHITEVLGLTVEEANSGRPKNEEEDLMPVRAPAAGVILSRNVTPGTVVTPSVDQFLISDLSRLWAIVEVNEEYLSKLRAGMPVRVQVQAYGPEVFPGKIAKIGDVLDPATRTVKVRVELRNSQGRLKPEMYASAEIELGSGTPMLTVPAEAIQEVRGVPCIFVRIEEGRFEARPVRTGRTFDHDVEVGGPIKSGDAVAVKGAFLLKSELLKASQGGE